MAMELKDQLTALSGEMKSFVEKANEEKKQHGTMLAETKTALENLQKQVDAVDLKLTSKSVGEVSKSLVDTLKENEDVSRLLRNRKGSTSITLKASDLIEHKTTVTSAAVGFTTPGIVTSERIPGIVADARQVLRLRDLLTARPTTMQMIDFIKVVTPLAPAGMVPETTLKPENAITFGVQSEKVRTIATFLPAAKQVMEDVTDLSSFIQDSLKYAVDLEEENQMIAGDGTGENLHGFITQAQVLPADTIAADNKIDLIGHAIAQLALSKETPPTFVVLNSADFWALRLSKDGQGRYLLGDPQMNFTPSIFGLTVVPTTSIALGTFLVGSGAAPATEIRDRQEVTVEISTEHADFFQRNMVAIRAEKRMALLVKRPNAFITGSFGSH